MRVFHAMAPSDLFQYKTPEQKLANDLTWLRTEQAALQERAREVGDVARNAPRATPDRAAILEVLARWKQYLEREQKARERLLDYAEKHPGKFKPEDIARLKSAGTDPTLLRQMRGAQAMLAIKSDGINRFSCAPGTLDLVIEQHRAVGNAIERVQTDPHTGQRTITVKPADGSPTFEITEQVPPKGKRTKAKVAVGTARHFEAWQELAKAAIGGPSGGPDRAIVADTLFTPSPSGSLPTLVTVDELVYLRLARRFADPPITWPKPLKKLPEPTMADKLRLAPEASGGVFTISILGHKMNIRYM